MSPAHGHQTNASNQQIATMLIFPSTRSVQDQRMHPDNQLHAPTRDVIKGTNKTKETIPSPGEKVRNHLTAPKIPKLSP